METNSLVQSVSTSQAETSLEESPGLNQERSELHFRIKVMMDEFTKCLQISERKFIALEKETEKFKAENAALQTKQMKAESESMRQCVTLTAAVDECSKTMKKQNLQINDLREDKERLCQQGKETQKYLSYHQKLLKELKMEHSKEMEMHKQDVEELNTVKTQNSALKEELERSKVLVNSYRTQLNHINTRCQQQQMCIRRFEEDLQSCVPVMTKSRELKEKFIDLKLRYLDDRRPVNYSENPEKEHEAKISLLEKNVESLKRTGQNYININRRMQQKLNVALSTFEKKESHYRQLLTLEKRKSEKLERELNEKDCQTQGLLALLSS